MDHAIKAEGAIPAHGVKPDAPVRQLKKLPDGTHYEACPRYPLRKLMKFDDDGNVIDRRMIPLKWIEALQQNQKLALCCRHPENHEIEARYSSLEQINGDKPGQGGPDIYILHCKCGKQHRRFMCGGVAGPNPFTGEVDVRPIWEVR